LIEGIISANKKNIPVINVDEQVDFQQLRARNGNMIGNYTTDNIAIGPGVLQAVQNANKTSLVMVLGIDVIPGALQLVQKGELDATVFQDAVGLRERAALTPSST
jgi:ABC-type sugar transport system substrate-binding protein